jgi:hypothetical protein
VDVKIYVIKKKSWRKNKVNGRPRVGKKRRKWYVNVYVQEF